MIKSTSQNKKILILLALFYNHIVFANLPTKPKTQGHSSPNTNWIFTIKKEPTEVVFKAKGYPGFLKVHGKSATGLTGTITKKNKHLNGSISFDLNTLDTGIGLRDKHMKKKYLHTKQHPNAILKVNIDLLKQKITLKDFLENKKEAVTITFDTPITLTINGIEKELPCKITLEWKKNKIHVRSILQTTLKNHKIPTPGYMGITLADEVNLDIKFFVDINALK